MKNIVTRFKELKKPIKIIIIASLIFAGIVSLFSMVVVYDYFSVDKMYYVVNDDGETCTVTGAKFPDDILLVLRIPEEINGYTVTEIAPYAFSHKEMMIAVIPETIEKIGEGAFSNCEGLFWVNGIQKCNNLKIIEKETFYNCNILTKIKLPESIEQIERKAFFKCYPLFDITIPKNVKLIEAGSFSLCANLKNINIPASVKDIDVTFVLNCIKLTNIRVDAENPYWCDIDGVLYSKDKKIIHTYPGGKQEKSFTVPEGVTEISDYLFAYDPNLEVLNIPASVNKIGKKIFVDAKIHTINYDGTVRMWNTINKSKDWKTDSNNFTIYCTDGQIAKDGTVTYK